MTVKVILGDVRRSLASLADESVNCVVTSPPYYGLRDYGIDGQVGLEPTPQDYIEEMVRVFREVKRVLRDDGTLWLNLGDSYSPGARKSQVAPTLRSKSSDSASGKQEYLNNFTVCPKGDPWSKPKEALGIPWRVAFALQADGWYLRQEIIWHKPNPMPESVRDRCTRAHEYIFLLTKRERYYFDHEAMREPESCGRVRGPALHPDKVSTNGNAGLANRVSDGKRNRRSVWTVNTKPFKGSHFATFPHELIEPCVLAGCPEGGVVLDPFGGSGTTGAVAESHGRNAILCELNADYAAMMGRRIYNDDLRGRMLDLGTAFDGLAKAIAGWDGDNLKDA